MGVVLYRCFCLAAVAACAFMPTGCASTGLTAARQNFYLGRLDRAADRLVREPRLDTDKVLFLMERGTVSQSRHEYATSAADWQEANALAERLDYLSVSRSTASMALNDRTLAFRGLPYERTLLHTFNAKNYLARAMWDDAAVEARNIIDRLENRGDFPDDPYSRYVAGLCLEMAGDRDGAALQYGIASELLDTLSVEERTGRIAGATDSAEAPTAGPGAELVCLVSFGHVGRFSESRHASSYYPGTPYAEIYCNGIRLGRSQPLANTAGLLGLTMKKLAAREVAKTAARIAAKEAAAEVLSNENEFLGELLRLILFAFEAPDDRRWEMLPLWLEVARLPCPADMAGYDIVFRKPNGEILERQSISTPLARRGKTFVSFCRTSRGL